MMNNDKFWQSYKSKCSERGIDAGTFEEFNKRQSTPQAFSSDMLVTFDKGIEGGDIQVEQVVKQCIVCNEIRTLDAFGALRNGEKRKICKVCHGKKISEARSTKPKVAVVEEMPPVQVDHAAQVMARKDFNAVMKNSSDESKEVGKVAIMELRVFHSALAMAYERGLSEGKSFNDLTVQEIDLPVILNDILGA